jgi:hypothetical protein
VGGAVWYFLLSAQRASAERTFRESEMLPGRWWLTFLALVMVGTTVRAQEINWQEAVARLARERTHAETCVTILKKYGDPATKDRASVSYGEAKAEYDGIVAGLIVVLARKEQPASLLDLKGQLQRGFEKREALCQSALSLIPERTGEKGVIEEIVSGAIGPLIQAVQAIYLRAKDDDLLTSKTIQTQLEATLWPALGSVMPQS